MNSEIDITKQFRMLLYGNKVDSDELTERFERVLDVNGCRVYDINIVENKDMMIVDVESYIQYIVMKGIIFESIPPESPLKKNKRSKKFVNKIGV